MSKADSPTKTCTHPDCDRPLRARGLCASHYNQAHQPDRHRKYPITCRTCGEPHDSSSKAGRYCSLACRDVGKFRHLRHPALWVPPRRTFSMRRVPPKAGAWTAGNCRVCASPFISQYTVTTCGTQCQAIALLDAKREAKHRRRARQHGAFVAPVSRRTVYERDQWTCQLCMRPVDRSAVVPQALAPTIDHVIALANGGTHEPGNVQCAHFLCNTRKGAA